MPNPFDAAMARAGVAIDRAVGESLRIIPMLPGRYKAGVADPARPAFDLTGTVLEAPGDLRVSDSPAGDEFNKPWAGERIAALITLVQIDGRDIRAGDRIRRNDLPGQPTLEITQPPDSDGAGGMIFRLTKVDA